MLNFFSSSFFSNILAIFGIIISLLPQKDTISIDNSRNYYFESNKRQNSTESSYTPIFLGAVTILFTYIFYALLRPYFTTILVVIYIATLIKYRYLGIPNRTQMFIPTFLIILSAFLPYFLPEEVTTFWNNAYKFDLNNINAFSNVINQLTKSIEELKTLFFTVNTDPLSVAILANIFFVLLIFVPIFSDLIKPKKYIKVTKKKEIIFMVILALIIISFMFFTNPQSPARILCDKFNYFFSN
ncbi:hypothetical protein [Carnobacterium divergens]|uniref:hypothetical protein n=1 Tax=Carnobacterium divergens TaxID=2748 RepID=UPI00288F74B4|nr:hypothetical protein [Carnobacterium divergens]MDT2010808.1 hypothetical protein [Carnobacterium divergens]